MRNIVLLVLIMFHSIAFAGLSDAIHAGVPNAKIAGQGTYTYIFWKAYDGKLYAPNGQYDANKPYALTLIYARELTGKSITDKTMDLIDPKGQYTDAQKANWEKTMSQIFPNIKPGDSLTGVYLANGQTQFYDQSGQLLGTVKDPQFGPAFFGIWLDKNTTAPRFRHQLLGGNS